MCSHYFPAWYLGTFPERHIILASYEAELAASWGRKARDVMLEHGPSLFDTYVRTDDAAASHWSLERTGGGMVTAGIGGPITGKGADVLIIDDPVKNAQEANSPTYRKTAWEWYVSTAYTRLEPGGSIILIQTRWHEDDLAGHLLTEMANGGDVWDVVSLPALAEDNDLLHRPPGAPLWPNRYPLDVLETTKLTLGSYWWTALYQQRPGPAGGGIFKSEWFKIIDERPAVYRRAVRYWDTAATEPRSGKAEPDFTVGTLLLHGLDNLWYIADVRRFQGSANTVLSSIKQVATLDGEDVPIYIEQEPGSSGPTVIAMYVRELAGWNVHGDPPRADKVTRAFPFSAQAEAGNVALVKGPWNSAFLDEVSVFPHGTHDDMVDSASGAMSAIQLAGRPNVRFLA